MKMPEKENMTCSAHPNSRGKGTWTSEPILAFAMALYLRGRYNGGTLQLINRRNDAQYR